MTMHIPHWYAVYTHPHAEKVAAEHLMIRDVEYFLPLYRKLSQWKNGMKVMIDLPLFPGYLFVKIPLCDRISVLQVSSIVRIVGVGAQPAPLPDHDIEILRIQLNNIAAEPHPFVSVGDRVRIKGGPLTGLEGFLVQKRNSYRFVLSLDLITQSIAVEVDACNVEALSRTTLRVHSGSVPMQVTEIRDAIIRPAMIAGSC